jgi:hypothetical protein
MENAEGGQRQQTRQVLVSTVAAMDSGQQVAENLARTLQQGRAALHFLPFASVLYARRVYTQRNDAGHATGCLRRRYGVSMPATQDRCATSHACRRFRLSLACINQPLILPMQLFSATQSLERPMLTNKHHEPETISAIDRSASQHQRTANCCSMQDRARLGGTLLTGLPVL